MKPRAAVAVVLLALVSLEILPCAFQEWPTRAAGDAGGFACRFEPLQVCDDGDPLLGALANLLVLVPAAPAPVLVPGLVVSLPDDAAGRPDRFEPSIDHPPRLSA